MEVLVSSTSGFSSLLWLMHVHLMWTNSKTYSVHAHVGRFWKWCQRRFEVCILISFQNRVGIHHIIVICVERLMLLSRPWWSLRHCRSPFHVLLIKLFHHHLVLHLSILAFHLLYSLSSIKVFMKLRQEGIVLGFHLHFNLALTFCLISFELLYKRLGFKFLADDCLWWTHRPCSYIVTNFRSILTKRRPITLKVPYTIIFKKWCLWCPNGSSLFNSISFYRICDWRFNCNSVNQGFY